MFGKLPVADWSNTTQIFVLVFTSIFFGIFISMTMGILYYQTLLFRWKDRYSASTIPEDFYQYYLIDCIHIIIFVSIIYFIINAFIPIPGSVHLSVPSLIFWFVKILGICLLTVGLAFIKASNGNAIHLISARSAKPKQDIMYYMLTMFIVTITVIPIGELIISALYRIPT
jgi:hypothetical protein